VAVRFQQVTQAAYGADVQSGTFQAATQAVDVDLDPVAGAGTVAVAGPGLRDLLLGDHVVAV
jgi:hypothetical protein